jgi:hypothetical protein
MTVSTIEYEYRWLDVWRLLSLDDAIPFYEELWVPFDPKVLSYGLKEVLGRFKNDSEPYLYDPSVVSYECFRWFEATFGATELQMLIRWTDSIYKGMGGLNRTAEWVWSQIPYKIRRDQLLRQQLDPRIIDFFERLIFKQHKIFSDVESRLELQLQTQISDWDVAADAMRNMERDADANTISNIISLNIFAFTWEKEASSLVPHELDQLYQFGKRLDSEHKVGLDGVAYPGSWRFFFLPFFQYAPESWKQ